MSENNVVIGKTTYNPYTVSQSYDFWQFSFNPDDGSYSGTINWGEQYGAKFVGLWSNNNGYVFNYMLGSTSNYINTLNFGNGNNILQDVASSSPGTDVQGSIGTISMGSGNNTINLSKTSVQNIQMGNGGTGTENITTGSGWVNTISINGDYNTNITVNHGGNSINSWGNGNNNITINGVAGVKGYGFNYIGLGNGNNSVTATDNRWIDTIDAGGGANSINIVGNTGIGYLSVGADSFV
jgi:hypothetical protein